METSEDIDLIRGRVLSVLETRKLERVLHPNYGTDEWVFESVRTLTPILEGIRASLFAQIPEVDSFEVVGEFEERSNSLFIQVDWVVASIPRAPINFRLEL